MVRKANDLLRKEYALWCAAKNAGSPGQWTSKSKWAEAHGIDRTTLYAWEKEPEHLQYQKDSINGLIPDDDFTQIIAIQRQKALEGNTAAANFVAKFKGYLDKPDKPAGADDLDGMSLEELIALRRSLE